MELPWRVTVVQSTKGSKVVGPEHQSRIETTRRKRSGKKRRIVIRKKIEARIAQKVANIQSQVEKDAAEREKRTRKNREKKVKKRQKDKAKKVNVVQDSA